MKLKKGDYIITILLISFSIVIAIFTGRFKDSVKGDTLVVEQNGKIYGEYSLKEDRIIEIKNHHDEKNIIEIKNNSAKMIEANCPDKICLRMPAISDGGQSIVCLPHRLYLTVKSEDSEVDQVIQ
ncbi:MAG: NusG domain II-containing protein [Tissierellia bacterium]|nr:NusG domain II-containing protein [Tissierellia bacterium]